MTLQDVLEKHGVGGGAAEKAAVLAKLDELMAEEAKARAVLESITAAVKTARVALVRHDKKEMKEGGGRSVVSGGPRSLFVPSYIINEAMARPIQSPPLVSGALRSQLVIYDKGYRKRAQVYLKDDRVGNTKMSNGIWTPRQLEEIGNCLIVDRNM